LAPTHVNISGTQTYLYTTIYDFFVVAVNVKITFLCDVMLYIYLDRYVQTLQMGQLPPFSSENRHLLPYSLELATRPCCEPEEFQSAFLIVTNVE